MVWDTIGRLVGTEMTNRANARQAAANRDFQERMSSTSYQRAVADMKSAGINPMLAAKVGGASTPGGATAQVADYGQAYSEGRKVDLQKKMNEAQVKQIEAQADLNSAQASNVRAQTVTEMTRPDLLRGQTSQALSSAALNEQATQKVLQEIPGVIAESVMKQLTVPEYQALARVYQLMDGDVGRTAKLLQEFKKGGAGVDNLINALGLSGLVRKLGRGESKSGKTVTHERRYTPKGSSETYRETWSE